MDDNRKKKSRNYERLSRFIKTLFHSINSEHKLSEEYIELIEELLSCVTKKICSQAAILVKNKSATTIIYSDIEAAILLTYPASLGDDTLEFVSKTLEIYNNSTDKERDITEKAGLILKVSRFRSQIKDYGYRVSHEVSIALTAAVEFLCRRIMEASIQNVTDNKSKLHPIDITSSINNDSYTHVILSDCIVQGL